MIVVITATARPGRRKIVGIVGAPGAGKSTLAAELVTRLGPDAVLLPMDGFHFPQRTLVELRRRERMGAPDTFDVPGLSGILNLLTDSQTSGNRVVAPAFDREIEEPILGAIEILPEIGTVVLEGNYLLLDSGGWEAIARYLDVSFFLEIAHEVRLERLIARHEQFGKSAEDARAWALGPDETNAQIIQTTAARADYLLRL